MSRERIVPTVHINGTDGQELFDKLMTAREALRIALAAMAECAPHMRDYYIKDNHRPAVQDHQARIAAVDDVFADITDIAMGVHEQNKLRRKS